VEFRGPSTTFRLLLESASEGEAGEVHLRFEEPAPPPQPEPGAVSGAAPGSLAAAPSPAPVETPRPAEVDPPAPRAAPAIFDLEGVLRAKPVSIGRREGLPGQRPMLLVDALQGDAWVWFRFALEGGGDAHIARISWEQGDIATFVQEPSGKDLRVIVQLPRAGVTRRAHLALEVESGPTYTFALSSRSLGGFLKELFR
jgi:hypothetical protein